MKNWVHDHPDEIGLEGSVPRYEYRFLTGDRADLLFKLPGNRFAVVEIETDNPDPGTQQALKYKVQKCVEENLDIASPKVEAVLVACVKPENSSLARKYGVRFVKKVL